VQEALEEQRGLLPADAQSAVVLEPRDRALDGPPSAIATQEAAVLRLDPAVGAVWRDEIAPRAGELIIQRIAVVGLVADDAASRS